MQRILSHRGRLPAAAILAVTLAACTEPAAPLKEPARFSAAAEQAGFFPLDVQFSDPGLCAAHGGFPVWIVLSGNLKVASVQTKGGRLRIVEILANGTVTLTANQRTLRSRLAGTAFYELDASDNLLSVTYVGLNGVFTVPGAGRIALETGKLVVDGDGNILFEAGPHHVFGSAPDVARLCAYLAG